MGKKPLFVVIVLYIDLKNTMRKQLLIVSNLFFLEKK